MKKSTEILGLKVISISEGQEIGLVKELVINPAAGKVAALVIDDGKWFHGAKVLPFSAVAGLGEYAVMVEDSDTLVPVTASPEVLQLLNAGISIVGTKVLTKAGQIQGKITEFLADETGKIVTCEMELANGEGIVPVPSEQVLTYGKEVTIISEIAGI